MASQRLSTKQDDSRKARNGRFAALKVVAKPPAESLEQFDLSPEASEEGRAETFKKRLLRLALDVHDGPMQNLTVIGLSLNDLKRRIQSIVPDEHHTKIDDSVGQITEELVQVEQELRALITALEEGATQSIPLLDAIEAEIREFKRLASAEVELVYDGNARAETDSQRIALQAITRSALTNVARHSGATKVTIRLQGTPTSITLQITDDGRGFDPGQASPGRFGVAGMRERAEMLGGSLTLDSRPGGPTTVTATLQSWRPPPA